MFSSDRLGRMLFLSVGAGTAFAGSEWLFFVTKSSALSDLAFSSQLVVLAQTASVLSLACIAGAAPGFVLGWVRPRLRPAVPVAMAAAIPSLLIAGMIFLLVENFTYTVFRFSVIALHGAARYAYGAAFLALVAYVAFRSAAFLNRGHAGAWLRGASWIGTAFVAGVALLSLSTADTHSAAPLAVRTPGQPELPNILIIGSDAVMADHMSAYGYGRDTTPTIRKWAADAVVAENAFSNADKTHSSVASLLTGKSPLRTRVFHQTQAFSEIHAYQHFPGILRSLGYRAADFGVILQGDPFLLNLKNGFELMSGGRRESAYAWVAWPETVGLVHENGGNFMKESAERLLTRIGHAVGWITAENPFLTVTKANARRVRNEERHRELMRYLKKAREPFFLHAHYMSTHGPKFSQTNRHFSVGKPQTTAWMDDFYDDAILDFDRMFGEILALLDARGMTERSIVVLYSDHGIKHRAFERVPLILRFPHGKHARHIPWNAQLLDIVPTLLEHLGVELPDWLDGRSLIAGPDLDPNRPLFVSYVKTGSQRQASGMGTEFLALGGIGAVFCGETFELDLVTGKISTNPVQHHTAPCPDGQIPKPAEAASVILGALERSGYPKESLNRLAQQVSK